MSLLLLALSACTPEVCPSVDDTLDETGPVDSAAEDTANTDTGVTDSGVTDSGATDTGAPVLSAEDAAAIAAWVSAPVEFVLVEGKAGVMGDRLSLLISATPEELELLDVLSRAQDHNSSRSNKSGIVDISDDFGDGDTATDDSSFVARWDGGPACTDALCPTDGNRDGEPSRLHVTLGESLDDDNVASMSFGRTLPTDASLEGHVALASYHRGHVTVLKAAADGDGGINVTSEASASAMAVYNGDELVFEGAPSSATIAMIAGDRAASWPKGIHVESSAIGTWVSLTW